MLELPDLAPAARQALLRKIRDGAFTAADLPEYLALFCATANKDGDVGDEVAGWDRAIFLALEDPQGDRTAWVKVAGGHFSSGLGAPPAAYLTLRMGAGEAARILVGDKDAKSSYLAGTLKVEGPLPDAIRFQNVVSLVLDALEI